MDNICLMADFIKIIIGKLKQQFYLLLGLAFLLPFIVFASSKGSFLLLSQRLPFSSVTITVTAPTGDKTPLYLENYLGNMKEIREYCTIRSASFEEAAASLEKGETNAVIKLPFDFINAVRRGENPNVEVIVNEEKPIESIVLLWLGESQCDLLAAVQTGIYNAIDIYYTSPQSSVPMNKMIKDINLEYIGWTMDRWNMFSVSEIKPTGILSIEEHYGLSILPFLMLLMSPLFYNICSSTWLKGFKRLLWVERSPAAIFNSSFIVISCLCAFYFGTSMLFAFPLDEGIKIFPFLAASFIMASLIILFSVFSNSAKNCGNFSFTAAFILLLISGGLIPPVLLPEGIKLLSLFSPLSYIRDLLAYSLGLTDLSIKAHLIYFVSGSLLYFISLFAYSAKFRKAA